MKTVIITALLTGILFIPSLSHAVAPAPHISDREIVERLTRLETKLEEGQKATNNRLDDINAQLSRMSAVFTPRWS
jgi:hypothetical protein